jgi:hypothetical protein
MRPIQLEGQLFDLRDDNNACSGERKACSDGKSGCRFLAFMLPAVIVIAMNTVCNWLDSPLVSVASLYSAFISSIAPGALAGLSGIVLYTIIKSAKRRLRAVSSGRHSKQLPAGD